MKKSCSQPFHFNFSQPFPFNFSKLKSVLLLNKFFLFYVKIKSSSTITFLKYEIVFYKQ